MHFTHLGSYATVPNLNITSCDFTIAFWVKSTGSEGPIVALRSISGKLFYLAIKSSIVFLSIYNTLEEAHFSKNDWNHIAVTCQHFKVKVFVNGTEKEQWNENFLLSDRFQHYYIIGNNLDLFKIPLITQPFVGSVMDLYVVGMALSVDQISDLFKGNMSKIDQGFQRPVLEFYFIPRPSKFLRIGGIRTSFKPIAECRLWARFCKNCSPGTPRDEAE